MTLRIFVAALLFMLAGAALRAAEPAAPPPAVGLSESAAKERAALFAALAATKSDAEAREVEDRIWTFWRSFADERIAAIAGGVATGTTAFRLRRSDPLHEGIGQARAAIRRRLNQLGYVYFLAGQYDASLKAIDRVLELEPMHYAALAGKGIILIQEGKVEEAQAPLKRALAIDPWLKERNLIVEDSSRKP